MFSLWSNRIFLFKLNCEQNLNAWKNKSRGARLKRRLRDSPKSNRPCHLTCTSQQPLKCFQELCAQLTVRQQPICVLHSMSTDHIALLYFAVIFHLCSVTTNTSKLPWDLASLAWITPVPCLSQELTEHGMWGCGGLTKNIRFHCMAQQRDMFWLYHSDINTVPSFQLNE